MRFFLDTANIAEIRDAASWGAIDGVTTNPSLVAKEGVSFEQRVKEICEVVKGPVSAEVTALDCDAMVKQGRILAGWAPNIYVKVPLTKDGLKACQIFSKEGIHTNVTLCFSPSQALLAAKAGADFVSPFVGRLDDISTEGMLLIRQIVQIYKNYSYKTEVLLASARHPLHIVEGALAGAHICTMPYKVLESLIKHPLTDRGIEMFLKDWEKVPKTDTPGMK
jgi:transaldolase